MSEHAGDTLTQNSDPQTTTAPFLTYRDLLKFHIPKYKDELSQRGKSEGSANNRETAANRWVEHAPWLNGRNGGDAEPPSASIDDPIGNEFSIDFEVRRAEHLDHLKELGYDASTIASRKYHLGRLQESYVKLLESNQLPDDFAGALKFLIEKHDVAQSRLAKQCGISESFLSRLADGSRKPSRHSLELVAAIEQFFHLQPGTLIFKLPSKLRGQGTTRHTTGNTPYREYLTVMRKKPYRLPYDSFTREQKDEWQALYRFYTDPGWVIAQGLERYPVGWRTRKNNNKNTTAQMRQLFVEQLYGFAILPAAPADPSLRGVEFDPDNKQHVGVPGFDPHLTGLGLDPEKLSLALFTDARVINEMVNFLRRRSFGNSHNTHTRNFLAFAAQLTREGEGFLYQLPEYGRRLKPPLPAKKWQERCREAHKKINDIRKFIANNRNEQERFNQTRDTTVEIVKPLIKEREHPISVMDEMAEGLRRDFKRAGTPEDKALLFRNMILVRIVTSNPMRAVNIAEMRYRAGAKGYEHEKVNLYKISDGSYRLKYEEGELKNGAIQGRYDLPVHPDLSGDLDEYFSMWRPLLLGAGECDYVFRHSTEGAPSLLARNPNAVREPMTESAISNIFRCASERYVPDCAGFGIHSARHFVATEYLKFNPGAYDIAATALHDSVEMVRDAYEWVTPDDKIVFWNEHLTAVLRKLRKEAA